eukprot:516598-Amphidinium_carterae.1
MKVGILACGLDYVWRVQHTPPVQVCRLPVLQCDSSANGPTATADMAARILATSCPRTACWAASTNDQHLYPPTPPQRRPDQMSQRWKTPNAYA